MAIRLSERYFAICYKTIMKEVWEMSEYDNLAVIILAAGKGTRMKSELAKVLHTLNAKSMISYVVETAVKIASDQVLVVIGHQAQAVKNEVERQFKVGFAHQKALLGTGDAVKSALPHLDETIKNVLIISGDVPLIKTKTIHDLLSMHQKKKAKASVLAVDMDNPTGYGRIILNEDGNVACIREEVDATQKELNIKTVNTGIYCFNKSLLSLALDQIKPDNKQAEYYLTDVIEIIQKNNGQIGVMTVDDPTRVMGVNTAEELEKAEHLLRLHLR